jgi:hypothetical protein
VCRGKVCGGVGSVRARDFRGVCLYNHGFGLWCVGVCGGVECIGARSEWGWGYDSLGVGGSGGLCGAGLREV